MELTFTNNDNLWVAEFEVRADFNIHLERDTDGRFDIWQKTAGGKYELINEIGYLGRRLVYDTDFTALVYPKTIKIISAINPTVCVVTAVGGDENITIVEPEVPEPEPEQPESDFLEMHFNIPMEKDPIMSGGADGDAYNGYMEGDYSSEFNRLKEFFIKNQTNNTISEEVMLEKTNITVNGYKGVSMWLNGADVDNGIIIDTNAPLFPGGGNGCVVTLTSISFECGGSPTAPDAL